MASIIFLSVLFLTCLVVMSAGLTNRRLREASLLRKILGYAIVVAVMGTLAGITANRLYDDVFGENGPVEISAIVGRIFQRYDVDRNDSIDVKTESSVDVEGEWDWHTYSRKTLFEAADVDRDGRVTRAEVTRAISRLDIDGNGLLTGVPSFYRRLAGARQPDELREFNHVYYENRGNGRREK